MANKKKELQAQAKARGIEFNSRTSVADLEAALAAPATEGQTSNANAGTAAASTGDAGTTSNDTAGTGGEGVTDADLGIDEVKSRFEEAQRQGFWGEEADKTPNENYTVPGNDLPTPETDEETRRAARA